MKPSSLFILSLATNAPIAIDSFGVANSITITNSQDSLVTRNLLPSQGRQLAAYYNSHKPIKHERGDKLRTDSEAIEPPAPVSFNNSEMDMSVTRQLIKKIFQLPSLLVHHESEYITHKDDVLQPVVGFRWVAVESEDGETTYQVLPPMGKCACLLPKKNKDEELYGWFSPACQLGSLYSDDEDKYCGEAAQSRTTQRP
jgi:hypothetical protein